MFQSTFSRYPFSLLICAFGAALCLFSACKKDECADVENIRIGSGYQYFTVSYIDISGVNYLDNGLFRPSEVVVYRNRYSVQEKKEELIRIDPGYADGKFGPFTFTDSYVDATTGRANEALLLGKTISYDYYIRKDTFGIDSFRVTFMLTRDVCKSSWNVLSYTRNGQKLPFDLKEKAAIVVTQ